MCFEGRTQYEDTGPFNEARQREIMVIAKALYDDNPDGEGDDWNEPRIDYYWDGEANRDLARFMLDAIDKYRNNPNDPEYAWIDEDYSWALDLNAYHEACLEFELNGGYEDE